MRRQSPHCSHKGVAEKTESLPHLIVLPDTLHVPLLREAIQVYNGLVKLAEQKIDPEYLFPDDLSQEFCRAHLLKHLGALTTLGVEVRAALVQPRQRAISRSCSVQARLRTVRRCRGGECGRQVQQVDMLGTPFVRGWLQNGRAWSWAWKVRGGGGCGKLAALDARWHRRKLAGGGAP